MYSSSEHAVLVVEDDLIQRRQLVRALEDSGYCLLQASNGMEAIRILFSEKVNLVLTDIRMPTVDGASLLKYIKTYLPHIPVVVSTAYPQEMEEIKPDALLCKPFRPEELINRVQLLLP